MRRLLRLAWCYSPGAILARRLCHSECPVTFDDLMWARLTLGYEVEVTTGAYLPKDADG